MEEAKKKQHESADRVMSELVIAAQRRTHDEDVANAAANHKEPTPNAAERKIFGPMLAIHSQVLSKYQCCPGEITWMWPMLQFTTQNAAKKKKEKLWANSAIHNSKCSNEENLVVISWHVAYLSPHFVIICIWKKSLVVNSPSSSKQPPAEHCFLLQENRWYPGTSGKERLKKQQHGNNNKDRIRGDSKEIWFQSWLGRFWWNDTLKNSIGLGIISCAHFADKW